LASLATTAVACGGRKAVAAKTTAEPDGGETDAISHRSIDGGRGHQSDAGDGSARFRSCPKPTAQMGVDGEPTGYVQCNADWNNSIVHRAERKACPSLVPRAAACPPPPAPDAGLGERQCHSDADCTAAAHSFCKRSMSFAPCTCEYGCRQDSDCAPGQICFCDDPVGQCVPADCTSDDDCEGEALCLSYIVNPGCFGIAFACQKPSDACADITDCLTIGDCTLTDGVRVCAPRTCAH
jgi:hypothetical protein